MPIPLTGRGGVGACEGFLLDTADASNLLSLQALIYLITKAKTWVYDLHGPSCSKGCRRSATRSWIKLAFALHVHQDTDGTLKILG